MGLMCFGVVNSVTPLTWADALRRGAAMWQPVVGEGEGRAPCTRSKHASCLLDSAIYVLGGRNGNLPLRDFWRFDLNRGQWEELRPEGSRPLNLQEHTMVGWEHQLFVFGGEVGFSGGSETPFWCYSVKKNEWRKLTSLPAAVERGQRPRSSTPPRTPKGLRGHSAVVHDRAMYLYGGYRDLKGSTGELWRYDFGSGRWQELHCGPGPTEGRHAHSAVLHDRSMWVFGGMTDLAERADLWKLDLDCLQWTAVRWRGTPPGPRHGHAAVRLLAWMLVYGGQSAGRSTTEVWRLHFATETWERVVTSDPQPVARTQCAAVAVSALLLPAERHALQRGHHPPVPVVHADVLQARRRIQVGAEPTSKPAHYIKPASDDDDADGGERDSDETELDQPQVWTDDRIRFIPAEDNRLRIRPLDGGPRFSATARGRDPAVWPSRVHVSGSQLLSRIAQVNLSGKQPSYSVLNNGSAESVEMHAIGPPPTSAAGRKAETAANGESTRELVNPEMTKSFSVYAMPPVETGSGFPRDRCSFPELLDAGEAPPLPEHMLEMRPLRAQPRRLGDGRPMPTGNRPANHSATSSCLSAGSAGRVVSTSHSVIDMDITSTSDYSSIEHCDITGYDNPNYVGYRRGGVTGAHDGREVPLPSVGGEKVASLSQSRDSGISERRPSPSSSPVLEELDQTLVPYYPVYMYTLGGKEVSPVTRFQRPLSVWRFQLA